ncbi:tetraspanin-2-like protein [Tanacetum coccineum]|uniref:Tetraspanin-2-like protein n=1 Tax=Tanacetum coccineum TaxID=301880 RepID=A0ABQ5FBR6_9ASTR
MAVANNIIATLNFIALLCSIPIITAGIWLASKQDNECIRWIRWPVIILGILFLLLSATGFIGAYWNKQGLLAFYLFCNAALIILGLVVLILAFVVTRPSGAYHVPGRVYEEHRLSGYSKWLRDHVTDDDAWGNIRACLGSSSVCTKMTQDSYSADQFYAKDISPLQPKRIGRRFFKYDPIPKVPDKHQDTKNTPFQHSFDFRGELKNRKIQDVSLETMTSHEVILSFLICICDEEQAEPNHNGRRCGKHLPRRLNKPDKETTQ